MYCNTSLSTLGLFKDVVTMNREVQGSNLKKTKSKNNHFCQELRKNRSTFLRLQFWLSDKTCHTCYYHNWPLIHGKKRKSMTSLLSSHNRNDVSLCWNKNDQQQTVCIVSMLEYYRILPLCMYTKGQQLCVWNLQ